MKRLSFVPILFGIFSPIVVFAADTTGIDKASSLINMIQNIISKLLWLMEYGGGAIIVLMIVIGGMQYIMNQKDAGKKTITAAVIGAIIIILSASLVAFVQARLEPLTTKFPTVNSTNTTTNP